MLETFSFASSRPHDKSTGDDSAVYGIRRLYFLLSVDLALRMIGGIHVVIIALMFHGSKIESKYFGMK